MFEADTKPARSLPYLGSPIDAESLRQELLRAARDADATVGDVDRYGARYTIDFELVRDHRRGTIRNAWIVLSGDNVPRLTSCYVLLD